MRASGQVERPTGAPGRRSLNRSLVIIVTQIVVLAGITVVLAPPSPEVTWVHLVILSVAAIYVATGVWAWTRRPTNPVGALIVAAGGALVLGNLGNSGNSVLEVIGLAVSPISIAVCIHLLLIFPGGRLIGWVPRVITCFTYASMLILQLALYTLVEIGATGTPVTVLQTAQGLSLLAIQVAVIVVLAGRLKRARPQTRRLLAPMYVYGMIVVILVPQLPALGLPTLVLFAAQLVLMVGVPLMFVVSVVRGGFAPESTLDVSGGTLALDSTGHKELTLALHRLLGDPTARLLLWSTGDGELRGLDGAPDDTVVVESSDLGPAFRAIDQDSALYIIGHGTETLGAIVYSDRLVNDRDVLDVAGRLAGASILRIRLTERLVRSEKALRNSRARVLAAADGARAQIAQNLHDSVQMRLVVLSMDAGTLASRLNERTPFAPPTVGVLQAAATALRRDIDTTAAELRDLVHEVMPPLLTERGLGAAIVALVDRAPLPADVEIGAAVDDEKIVRDVQHALYFVAAESLTNVYKHSNANRLSVRLDLYASRAGHPAQPKMELVLDVVDDGVGFDWMSATSRAHTQMGWPEEHRSRGIGVGVRGIIDRVEAINGQVEFSTMVGGGTRVRVRVPCES